MTNEPVDSCPACASATGGKIEHVDGVTLAHCANCGTRWMDPPPSPSDLSHIYTYGYYSSGRPESRGYAREENAEGIRYTAAGRARALERVLAAGSSVLEVGSGRGILGRELARTFSYEGLELSAEGAAEARTHGLRVHEADLEGFESARRFDAVILVHVFEHLLDPSLALRRIDALLKDGGLLYVVTPDTTSMLARISGPRWVSYKFPEHVILYSRKGLARLLERRGFEVTSMRADREYCDHPFLVSRLRSLWPPLGVIGRITLSLAPHLVKVPSGSVVLYARKHAIK